MIYQTEEGKWREVTPEEWDKLSEGMRSILAPKTTLEKWQDEKQLHGALLVKKIL